MRDLDRIQFDPASGSASICADNFVMTDKTLQFVRSRRLSWNFSRAAPRMPSVIPR